jgi:hypothetical protein
VPSPPLSEFFLSRSQIRGEWEEGNDGGGACGGGH